MWVNEQIRPRFIDRIYSFSRKNFMADRMGLDSPFLSFAQAFSAVIVRQNGVPQSMAS